MMIVSSVEEEEPTSKVVSFVWHLTASGCIAPVLVLWMVWSTSSYLDPLLNGVVVNVMVPPMGQIDLFENY